VIHIKTEERCVKYTFNFIAFYVVFQAALVVLKLQNWIDWSWVWVTFPSWWWLAVIAGIISMCFAIMLVVGVLMGIAAIGVAIYEKFDEIKERKRKLK
jgi:TctA family transporter